jgi:hypothetical protein
MWRALELTSIVLYQQEGGADALRFVLMGGDREQDAVYAGFILESTIGRVLRLNSRKRRSQWPPASRIISGRWPTLWT